MPSRLLLLCLLILVFPSIQAADDPDYTRYLNAVALADAKKYEEAIVNCEAIPASHEWYRKALFLRAHCLGELKRHQEAEAIYSAEATRLFATERKEKLAEALVKLARDLTQHASEQARRPQPEAAGENSGLDAELRAMALYQKALELDTGPVMRENLRFQIVSLARRKLDPQKFQTECGDYLREFDPDWRGHVHDQNSSHLLLTGARPPDSAAKQTGARRWEVRGMLIDSLIQTGCGDAARRYAEDILTLWKTKPPVADAKPDKGDFEWMICRSHAPICGDAVQMSNVQNDQQQGFVQGAMVHPSSTPDSEKHVAALRQFLKDNPAHAHSAEAAMALVQALTSQKKPEEAIAACQTFYERADWPLPAAEDVHQMNQPQRSPATTNRTPQERLAAWKQEAFFQFGELRFSMRKYPDAIEQWRAYIAKHPDGSLWQSAQARIMDAEFQRCLEAVAANDWAEATRRFDAFIAAHPLEPRCAKLLFLNGQWAYLEALKAGEGEKPLLESAIAEWAKLITKHPQSEEASLALFKTAMIQAKHLDRHEETLSSLQRLTWGGSKEEAGKHAAQMTQRSLALRTPRNFRTNETAHVLVNVRNIEKLKVFQYKLNLEDFFRSRHRLDGFTSLDIDLIQPDKTWEVNVAGYARLKPIEQSIEVPFEEAKPGVCLIRVEGEDWQSSTIVMRSDIDLIVQSAWKESLVLVLDRVKGTAVGDAEILLSNGKEVIAQGRTAADGVFRFRSEMIRAAADLCVHVSTPAGVAIQRLDLRGMTQEITGGDSVALARQGFVYTDKPAYRAGETVHFRGIIRDVADGNYTVPTGREYEIRLIDGSGKVLRRIKAVLSDFGTFTHSVPLPERSPLGWYRIIAQSGDERHSTSFEVSDFKVAEIQADFETNPGAIFRGDKITGTLRLRYSAGGPLGNESIRLQMPDGRLLDGKTDGEGSFTFTQETSAFQPGSYVTFMAGLPTRQTTFSHTVSLLQAGLRLKWGHLPDPALSGEPALIRVQALDHLGKPTAATVKLIVSRIDPPAVNAVLDGLPGLDYLKEATAPVKLEELTLQTDPTTGLGNASPILQQPGLHQLIAQTTDSRGAPVEIQTTLNVPRADSKLHLLSDDSEVNEGAILKLDAHIRIAAPLALVTLAGEEIIEHRIVPLVSGHNELPVTVSVAHWPHFQVSVAYLDGEKLHRSSRGFEVKRSLKIKIDAPEQPVKPGDPVEITLTATDTNGKPVAAELSLALASTNFFALHPDQTDIEKAFHGSLRRATSLRTSTTAGFEHRAASRVLTRDESGNLASSTEIAPHGQLEWDPPEIDRQSYIIPYQAQERDQTRTNYYSSAQDQTRLNYYSTARDQTRASFLRQVSEDWELPAVNQGLSTPGMAESSVERVFGEFWQRQATIGTAEQWHCPLITNDKGLVNVKLTAPSRPGQWRMAVRACTLTSFAQVEKTLETKFDFYPEIQIPRSMYPGDSFTPKLLLHLAPESTESTATPSFSFLPPLDKTEGSPLKKNPISLKPGGTVATSLEPITAPNLTGRYFARLGIKTERAWQVLSTTSQVFPKGETTSLRIARIAQDELFLPAAPATSLSLRTFPSPLSLLHGMSSRLEGSTQSTPQTSASFLLSRISAAGAGFLGENRAFQEEILRTLISELQITQRDGGWTWQGVDWQRDSIVTSLGLWALVEAGALGFEVEASAIKDATAYLKEALAIIPPDEPDKAAVILHALACVNEADFSVANRMFRDRAKLNDPALAWLAAAFQRMNRVDEAKEVLKALEAKPAWTGSKTTSRLSRDEDTAAAVLYAAARISPGSPLEKKAGDQVLQQLGVELGADSALQGVWTAALARHFVNQGLHQAIPAEKIEATLNGESIPLLLVNHFTPPQPAADGRTKIVFSWKDGVGTPVVLASFINETAVNLAAPSQANLPEVVKREWLHEGLRHHDVPLQAHSSSPVKVAAHGQRIRVRLELKAPTQPQTGYAILDEPLPGGCRLIPDTLSAEADRVEELPGMLRLWFIPGSFREDAVITYELMAKYPGTYQIPHTRVRDACRPERFNAGAEGKLTVLEPGQPSPDSYAINREERLELAEKLFEENAHEEARLHLEALRSDPAAMKDHERDIARMLLWIHTARQGMDARQVVELFEALSERHADIVIPFDKILKVAAAYREIGEFERAWLVYRATLESNFVSEAGFSAALETAGDFPGSAGHQMSLWMEHPDGADGLLAYFSLAQRFQELAANPAGVPLRPGAAKWTKIQLQERSRDLLSRFVQLHSKDELADDAAFTLANVFFDLKDYPGVVNTASQAVTAFPKSTFLNQFHYMTALGRFWQYQFPEALAAAAPVAAGSSEDAPNARYITAQIHHARSKAAEAIEWYEKVKDDFEDARESIRVLQEKGVKLPHAIRVKPGDPVKLELDYRNVKEADLQIYRVDLLKLQERQKDLSSVGSVNLSGITPQAEIKVPLGDGLDYTWKKRPIELPLKDEGAYLVICRGDSQMTSGIVLLTTLDMEVHEDNGGNVRVQVRDSTRNAYVADADIAIYDSTATTPPQKGRTDPRGAFAANEIHGYATVVVKVGEARYAIHRGATPLKPPSSSPAQNRTNSERGGRNVIVVPIPNKNAPAAGKPMSKDDYLFNVKGQLDINNGSNKASWKSKMESGGRGVKAEKAFKK